MRAVLTPILSLAIMFVSYAEGAEVRDLIAKLKSKDNEARRSAAKELGELGAEAKSAVPDLIRALKDADLFVRRFAAEALGNIGPDAKGAASALSLAMNDSRKEVGEAAADALGKIGPAGIAALSAAVKDTNKDPNIRRKAAAGLAKLGREARSSVSSLTEVLSGKIKAGKKKGKGNDEDIRVEVATALGAVASPDDKAAIEALKAVSEGKQRNRALKKAATDALRQINGKGSRKKKDS